VKAPPGFVARRFLAGNDDLVVASFPLAQPAAQAGTPLTASEREIIKALMAGHSYAAIAQARGRAVSTVAKQVGSVFRKLGVSSRAELAARGVLPPSPREED
jgi:DNA-binding CsgD family transcriptional regulator